MGDDRGGSHAPQRQEKVVKKRKKQEESIEGHLIDWRYGHVVVTDSCGNGVIQPCHCRQWKVK